MPVTLDHAIVPARDKEASARWLAELLELEVRPWAHFFGVQVGAVSLDFDDAEAFEPHHYAFLVDDAAFDRIFARVRAFGLTYAADPYYRKTGEINHHYRKTGEINHRAGGRGFYFHDPNGHNLELLTRPQ